MDSIHFHRARWLRVRLLVILVWLFGLACSVSISFPSAEGQISPDLDITEETIVQADRSSAVTPAAPNSGPLENQLPGEVFTAEHGQTSLPGEPNFADLERYMVHLINRDRQENGLAPVEWDPLAAIVGRNHAREMAEYNYLSHWNRAGLGPDVRYGLAGGTEFVQENVYAYFQRYDNGDPVPIVDWLAMIDKAQQALMDSPGHRANILDDFHTHVGIGIAYNPSSGELRISQEFINRYISFKQPRQWPLEFQTGEELNLHAELAEQAMRPVINLAYQPFPEQMSVEALRETDSYASPAQVVWASPPLEAEGEELQAETPIPADAQPGLYHVRVWLIKNGQNIPAGNLLLVVE